MRSVKLEHAFPLVRHVVENAPAPLSVFVADARVGAVGVSGLPGEEDDALARSAIAAAGLKAHD